MSYRGVIIEESLENKNVLKNVNILSTKIEDVKEKHRTPWVKTWTLDTVEIPEEKIDDIAEELSLSLDKEHSWYADFRNKTTHYIIFRNKIFYIDRTNIRQYNLARKYGLVLGIPEYQVNFCANVIKK